MTIVTVIVEDPSNPVEVQAWFDEHPSVTVKEFAVQGNLFYLLYE